jgi:hypothetical protein
MSFKSGNLNFENEFRDGQARRDGQAHPLQFFIINRLRRFFCLLVVMFFLQ